MSCNNTEIISERKVDRKPQTSNNTYHPKHITDLRTAAYIDSNNDQRESVTGESNY